MTPESLQDVALARLLGENPEASVRRAAADLLDAMAGLASKSAAFRALEQSLERIRDGLYDPHVDHDDLFGQLLAVAQETESIDSSDPFEAIRAFVTKYDIMSSKMRKEVPPIPPISADLPLIEAVSEFRAELVRNGSLETCLRALRPPGGDVFPGVPLRDARLSALTRLAVLGAVIQISNAELEPAVKTARELDLSWKDVGRAVGISGQAATRRWDEDAHRRHNEYQRNRHKPKEPDSQ